MGTESIGFVFLDIVVVDDNDGFLCLNMGLCIWLQVPEKAKGVEFPGLGVTDSFRSYHGCCEWISDTLEEEQSS